MKNIIIGVMLTLFSFSSFAEELDVSISGSDIATFRTFTDNHSNNGTENIVMLKIFGLPAPCTKGLFVDGKSNSVAYSHLLAAYHTKKNLTVGYDTTVPNPWGDSRYCAVTYVDI